MERCCKKCGFDLNSFNPGENPYAFCPAGPCNPVEMKIGETCDINPAGYDNCAKPHEFIRWQHYHISANNFFSIEGKKMLVSQRIVWV